MEDLYRKEIDQSDKSLLQTFEIHFQTEKHNFSPIFCYCVSMLSRYWEKKENKASDWFSQMDKNQSNNDPPKK